LFLFVRKNAYFPIFGLSVRNNYIGLNNRASVSCCIQRHIQEVAAPLSVVQSLVGHAVVTNQPFSFGLFSRHCHDHLISLQIDLFVMALSPKCEH